ncbi:glucosaminidase domain-containing protein [Polaribacter sp. Asnod1-A03]|uniref:glucosaminidase domain-containing protein n=1 Tax=Polaribacter sp. Asnod1-A03 TaxID=3160581 RepID=UPI00386BEB55
MYCICLLIFASCGSKKRVLSKKKNSGVVLNEPKPKNLPSVNEKEITRDLASKNPNLSNKTIAYIRKYAPIAVKEMYDYKIPASITLAQGILESGGGTGTLASKSNNHFGIKCHTGWLGERVYHDDDEKGECFRKYQYVETSYKDHSEFLSKRKRYAFLFNYSTEDYKKWAKGLKKAGYATDKQYPNKLIRIIEMYKLYEFDKPTSKKNKAIEPTYTNNYYIVKKGDTLYSIAKKLQTSVKRIKEVNQLNNNTISINQRLIIK